MGVPEIAAGTLGRLEGAPEALTALQRGIEKESLRVAADGHLSQLPHPQALGSPLTHPQITTDFSEAQLELMEGLFLPSRVRIRIELSLDRDTQVSMETQVEMPLTEPLWY